MLILIVVVAAFSLFFDSAAMVIAVVGQKLLSLAPTTAVGTASVLFLVAFAGLCALAVLENMYENR